MAVALTSLPAVVAGDSGEIANANTIHTAVNALTAEMQGGVMNLRAQVGVVGDGTNDDATALNSAFVSAAALGVRAYASGTFKIGSTVTISCDADLSAATFNYTGSTVAVQVGAGTSGTILYRRTIALPKVINSSKVGTGWTAGTIGVKASNTYGCVIWVPQIQGFETGYYAYGLGTGNVYNEVHALHLDNNKRNLVLGAGTGGWSNSNAYHLGVVTHLSAEGASVSGTREILCESATNLVNGNRFVGGSVEGDVAEFHLEDNGLYNIYDGIRWENSGGCRIKWGATAARNEIRGGYTAHSIVETHTAGSALNRIATTGMTRINGSTSQSVLELENTSSSTAFAAAVMDPGATLAGSAPATAYRVGISADAIKGKRAADTNDRIVLDSVNGRLYLGNAAGAIAMYLTAVSTSGVSLNAGNLYSGTDNTYELGLISSLRFKYIRAATAVVTGAAATGSRPAAATAGAGAMFFDTTLVIPIWSDGTTWRNASGTSV